MYVMCLPLLSREDLKIVYGRNEHVIDRCIQYDEPAFALSMYVCMYPCMYAYMYLVSITILAYCTTYSPYSKYSNHPVW